jgi:hypothetical protein
VLARIGTVERGWVSSCQEVEADAKLGLLEEVKPQAEIHKHVARDPADVSCRRE